MCCAIMALTTPSSQSFVSATLQNALASVEYEAQYVCISKRVSENENRKYNCTIPFARSDKSFLKPPGRPAMKIPRTCVVRMV